MLKGLLLRLLFTRAAVEAQSKPIILPVLLYFSFSLRKFNIYQPKDLTIALESTSIRNKVSFISIVSVILFYENYFSIRVISWDVGNRTPFSLVFQAMKKSILHQKYLKNKCNFLICKKPYCFGFTFWPENNNPV